MSTRNDTMLFKNPTTHTIKLDAVGLDPVEPGKTVEVPLALCAPGRSDSGTRAKSALECVAPQLVPASESDHAIWMGVPPPPTPISKIVSIQPQRAPQEAPGVKALREQREKALAASQTKDTKAPQKTEG